MFAVQSFEELTSEAQNGLPELDSPLCQRLHAVINEIRRRTPGKYQSIAVLLEGPDSPALKSWLVEDATPSDMSYPDYLLSLHRVIMSRVDS